jgi:hypothetical protein
VSYLEPAETMGDEFSDGTRPMAPNLTADQIQALRKQERAEKARQARLSPYGQGCPEILE